MHAMMGALELVGKLVRLGRGRLGIGHFEHGGDATEHRTARSRFQIFLPLHARLAEMNLAVDHPGKDMQTGAVKHLAGGSLGEIADLDDLAVTDADIGTAATIMVHHFAALEQEIEGLAHDWVLSKRSMAA